MSAVVAIKPLGSNDTGRCPCCGRVSRRVWGEVQGQGSADGSYFVHWTIGHVFENGADFHIILRGLGKDANTSNRYAVSLEYRILDNGPAFMVVDARQTASLKSVHLPTIASSAPTSSVDHLLQLCSTFATRSSQETIASPPCGTSRKQPDQVMAFVPLNPSSAHMRATG